MRNNGLLRSAADTIRRYDMLRQGERVLVALSGGADSVSLLLVLQALGYEVRAFHLNHCLRGAESDRDEAFCRALCAERGVPLHVGRCDIAALSQGKAVEETARRERYRLLERAAEGDKVATAHTADDNLETVLFHLVRGSGAKGVSGIPPVRGAVIRPLLFAERREIEAFLRENGQDYVTDSSNLSDDYTRNRLRHSVLPMLRGINEQAAQAALRLGEQLRQDEACLGGQAERCLQIALRADGAYLTAPFLACHPAVRDAPECPCATLRRRTSRRWSACFRVQTRPRSLTCRTALRHDASTRPSASRRVRAGCSRRRCRSPFRLTACGRTERESNSEN